MTSNCHKTVISAERPNCILNQSQVSLKITNQNSNRKQNKIGSNIKPTKNEDSVNFRLNQDEKQSSVGVLVWNLLGLKGNKIDIFKEENDTVVKKMLACERPEKMILFASRKRGVTNTTRTFLF